MKQRLDILRQNLKKSGLDAALITSGVNIRYYSGCTSSDGVLVVTQKGAYLVTDFRYTIQAKAQVKGCAEVVEATYADQMPRIRGFFESDGAKRVGFEQNHLSVGAFEEYKTFPVAWEPFHDAITAPRLYKSAEEVASLQAAQRIADKSYAEFLGRVRPGMTEQEATAELLYVCAKNGSEGPSFDPIVAGGPNSAMCHAVPGARRIQKGDLGVVDFGCVADGYHSDMTRTFGVGSIGAEEKKIYEIVKTAQHLALDALVNGVSRKALDAAARDYIAGKGYGAACGHGLGHGFGLEIHEPPRAAMSSVDTLTAGMTITVEPGIYVEGLCGVRIEDCCVVTETGHLNLVSSPKELTII